MKKHLILATDTYRTHCGRIVTYPSENFVTKVEESTCHTCVQTKRRASTHAPIAIKFDLARRIANLPLKQYKNGTSIGRVGWYYVVSKPLNDYYARSTELFRSNAAGETVPIAKIETQENDPRAICHVLANYIQTMPSNRL